VTVSAAPSPDGDAPSSDGQPSDAPTAQPGARSSRGWIRRLIAYLRPHRRNVAVAFGAAVAGMVVAALTPVVEKIILDDVILSGERSLAPWLVVLLGAGLFRFGAAHLRRFVGGRVALDLQYDLRNDIYERLQRLDFARHDEVRTGQLVSRAISDVALVQGLLAFLPLTSGNLVMLVVSVVVMAALSPLLTVIALLVVPAVLLIGRRLRTTVFPASWDAQQKAGEVAGVVEEAVSGVRVVKGFGQEDRELGRMAETSRGLFASRMRAVRIEAKFGSTLQVIPMMGQVAVLVVGGWLAMNGRISLGTFLAFSSYLVQMMSPARMFSALLAMGQQARAGAERIFELIDSNPIVTERPDARPLPPLEGRIDFEDVAFGYLRSEPVLSGFSLSVRPGETVALVGASGSGKSTVALLLPRFYDVQSGAVRVDGVDVRDVTFDSLRSQVGVVFEETFLFSNSVRDNIAYGRPGATEEEVMAAARAAEAHDFITALPNGYGTVLGESGYTLSGGQRQRIALARAILTDPRVLVLDDATSSLDARVEAEIHATLRRLMRGRTTLLVAHRRSTLRLADRIAVVDEGRVVDTGTHDELMTRCRLYRSLLAGPGERVDSAADGDGSEPVDDGFAPEDALSESNGVTPEAWRPVEGAAPRAHSAPAPTGDGLWHGSIGHGAGHHMSDRVAMLAPTPELLASVEALPPATDDPDVDPAEQSAPQLGFHLGRFLRPYRRQLAVGVVLVVLDTVAIVAGPVLVRLGVDRGIVTGSERALWLASVAFLAIVMAQWAVVWAGQRYTSRIAERLLFALRVRMFAHLQRLGLDYYEREAAGRIMTRMTTDVESLTRLLQHGVTHAVSSLLSFVAVAVVLMVMNVPLSLATMAVLLPLVVATLWFRRRSAAAYAKARERIATVNANLQEGLSGVRVTQAYRREELNIKDFRRVARTHLEARLGAQRLVATYFPFVELLSQVAAVVVLGAGATLVRSGSLTTGELIAFLLYLNQLFPPIQQLSQVFDSYQEARASTEKIGELLETPALITPAARPVHPGRLEGAIRFEQVRFRYPGMSVEALRGVDFEIQPGQTVALVGQTGAGKSTIVKLIARFYDPTEGSILVDGMPLVDLDMTAYRRQLGYVPQEPFLFSGTIRDNIAYGRPDATDAEVEEAARAVGAHDFVAALPGGYLHPVTERGRSLSAGQRQLIALARARLVEPAILLLDEATANLDMATESRVVRAMGVVVKGRTTVLIAHRLQTAMRADRILVVDDGRVVEDGTHEELLARGGAYTAMWESFGLTAQAV
jgi:ATP-binding cassette subfamily B protein